jgi:ATP-dependent DNA helicase RecQ
MRARTTAPIVAPRLLELLELGIGRLRSTNAFGSVAMMPSRSWAQRESLGQWLAEFLEVPLLEIVTYKSDDEPAARQGSLANNDQRRENVSGCFALGPDARQVPGGAVLLVDDYMGSRATLREVGQVLRKAGKLKQDIVPLMIARVRWKLGQPGMI